LTYYKKNAKNFNYLNEVKDMDFSSIRAIKKAYKAIIAAAALAAGRPAVLIRNTNI